MANNHFEVFGSHTANSLRMQLGIRKLIWEEKKQKTLGNFFRYKLSLRNDSI